MTLAEVDTRFNRSLLVVLIWLRMLKPEFSSCAVLVDFFSKSAPKLYEIGAVALVWNKF